MFKAEVQVVNEWGGVATGTSKWYSNSLKFESHAKAEAYAKDLFERWTQTVDWRVIEIK